jgi:hypothetical protein
VAYVARDCRQVSPVDATIIAFLISKESQDHISPFAIHITNSIDKQSDREFFFMVLWFVII